MNVLGRLAGLLFSPEDVLPPRMGKALIDDGIRVVQRAVDAERRVAEEAEREASVLRSEDAASGRYDTRRYKSQISFGSSQESADFKALFEKRPPDLHAPNLTFSARLVKYVHEKCGYRASVLYHRAGVSRQVYSKIVSNDHSAVSKVTALQFAIAMQLDLAEAENLLQSAGYALSKTIPLDVAFAYCIQNRIWNIFDVNEILVSCGLEPLTIQL